MISFLWRLIPGVRPRERTRFLFFLTLDLLLSLSQTLGLVAIESLILSHFGSEALPLNFVAASVVTVIGSLLYALGVNRSKNDLYFINLHIVFTVLVLVFWAIGPHYPWAYLVLGCIYYLSSAVLNNHYWTFTGDFFDTLSSKRLFPIFIIGNSLGGFLGGAFISADWFDTETLLPMWAGLMLLTAVLLRVFRRSLRRWGPLELEEADETSLAGIRNSLLYLRQSSLGRWMVAACFALITSLFISQYLYSQIFSDTYKDAEQLTHFFGQLLAVTNLMEIVIEGWITPLLMRYLGVATANLLHPLTTLLGFCLLSFRFSVGSAILARINRETLDNAMGQPIRNLVYNALPDRFRGRLRAFLEGIVVYTGMALAGLFLMFSVGRISSQTLTYCGMGASLVYLWANSRVRAAYLKTLIEELQAGRLELGELGDELATFEVHRLGQLWEALTGDVGDHPNPVAIRFAKTLSSRGVYEPLLHTARQGRQIWLRCTCIRALGKEAWRNPTVIDLAAVGEGPDLKLAALEVLAARAQSPDGRGLEEPIWLEQLSRDEDPQVRAQALSQLIQRLPQQEAKRRRCLDELLAQANQSDLQHSLPALFLLPAEATTCLLQRAQDPVGEVRVASLRRLGELEAGQHHQLFLQALNDNESAVKVEALAALANGRLSPQELARLSPVNRPLSGLAIGLAGPDSDRDLDRVTGLLWSPSAEVRSGAARLLARLGELAMPKLIPCLTCEDSRTVVAALDALSLMANQRAREQMALQLRQRTQQIWYLKLAGLLVEAQIVGSDPVQAQALKFLNLTLNDADRRDLKLAFEILSHIEDPKVMRSVEKVLRFANLRARSDALEVLSNLGDREASNLLVLLLEDTAWVERISGLPLSLRKPADTREVLQWCQDSRDRWLQLAAQAVIKVLPASGRQELAAQSGDDNFKKKEKLMERLLVLRKVPLFAQMSLDQLEAINHLLKEAQYLKGETIFDQGDLGDELFILVEGGVRIVQGKGSGEELELNRMQGVSYFGEMSILDDEPRSASVVCYEDSRVLVLKGDQLKDLIHQMPDISFEIFKVLTARIRVTNARVGSAALRSGEVRTN